MAAILLVEACRTAHSDQASKGGSLRSYRACQQRGAQLRPNSVLRKVTRCFAISSLQSTQSTYVEPETKRAATALHGRLLPSPGGFTV